MEIRSFAVGEILKLNRRTNVLVGPSPVLCIDEIGTVEDWKWQPLETRPTEYTVYSRRMNAAELTAWVEKLGRRYEATDVIFRTDPVDTRLLSPHEQQHLPPGTTSFCIFIILDDPDSERRQKKKAGSPRKFGREAAMVVWRKTNGYGMVLHTRGDCISIQVQQLGMTAILQTFEPPPGDGIWVWEGEPFGRPGTIADYSNGEWRRPNHWEWQQLRLGNDPFEPEFFIRLQPTSGPTYMEVVETMKKHLMTGGTRWFRAPDKRG